MLLYNHIYYAYIVLYTYTSKILYIFALKFKLFFIEIVQIKFFRSTTTEKKISIKSTAKQLTETVALIPMSTTAAPSGTKINQAVATTGPVKEYTSVFGRLDVACGAKKELCHGPNEELLL